MPKYTMPVGKSDFAKLRTAGDYYVDKTDLIRTTTLWKVSEYEYAAAFL